MHASEFLVHLLQVEPDSILGTEPLVTLRTLGVLVLQVMLLPNMLLQAFVAHEKAQTTFALELVWGRRVWRAL